MTIQDWAALGEIVGAAGVIVTLIYLAIQIRENSRQIQIGAIASINQLINEGFDPIYNSEYNTRVWFEGLALKDGRDETEVQLFHLFMARMMNTFQTSLVQYQHQTLNETDFQRYAAIFKGILETPGGRDWFESIGINMMSEDGIHVLISKMEVSIPQLDAADSNRPKSAA